MLLERDNLLFALYYWREIIRLPGFGDHSSESKRKIKNTLAIVHKSVKKNNNTIVLRGPKVLNVIKMPL